MLKKYSFSKALRLRKPFEFDHVFSEKKRLVSKYFIVYYQGNNQIKPRLGIIISKRTARSAVDRNKIKRLVREVFRKTQCNIGGYDVIIIAQKQVLNALNEDIRVCLNELFQCLPNYSSKLCC